MANRPSPHFLVPALAPTILALASIRAIRQPVRWLLAPLAAAFAVIVPLAWVAGTDFNAFQAYSALPKAQLGQHRPQCSARLDTLSPAGQAPASLILRSG